MVVYSSSDIHIYIHTYKHTYIHTNPPQTSSQIMLMSSQNHIYIHIRIYIYTYIGSALIQNAFKTWFPLNSAPEKQPNHADIIDTTYVYTYTHT